MKTDNLYYQINFFLDHLPLKKRRVDPQFCKNLFKNAEGPEVRTTRTSQAADKKEVVSLI